MSKVILAALLGFASFQSDFLLQVIPIKSVSFQTPDPQLPTTAVIEAFNQYSIIALAEAHRLQEEHDFITSLIRDPAFPMKVNDIVIEWGNALYQSTLDRYMAGEEVPLSELRKVWRNTGFSPFAPWDAPVYERFFQTIRSVNQQLSPPRRLRVLAGDPPVDWGKSRDEITAIKQRHPRDRHFAEGVINEVLSKNRKALVLMGGNHLYRYSWNPYSDQQPETVIDLLDRYRPKAVFVIMAHAYESRNAELEARLAKWPRPSLVILKNTWLGMIETERLMSQTITRGFPDGRVFTVKINAYPGTKLEDLADAYIYFGDMESLTASIPAPEMYRADPEYLHELQRRYEMISGGRQFPVETLLKERASNKYYTGSSGPPPLPPRRDD